jgi:hypothetical protein
MAESEKAYYWNYTTLNTCKLGPPFCQPTSLSESLWLMAITTYEPNYILCIKS